FAFIGVAQLLLKAGRLSPSVTRKVIHIGVAHWWLLAMVFFDRWQFAIVGPVAFIFINLASCLFRLFPAMEHEKRRKNLGTIYFPIALLVMVLSTWAGPVPIWIGGLGILVLGWGDGLASIVGEGREQGILTVLGNRKSVAGTLTMFLVSAIVTLVFTLVFADPAGEPVNAMLALAPRIGTVAAVAIAVVSTAVVATATELVTPYGLDNLTVPIVTMLFFHLV
ncbi:MAG: diacylglycerol/polyprenol kinase family protein, partial [Spirochaetota bacterium]